MKNLWCFTTDRSWCINLNNTFKWKYSWLSISFGYCSGTARNRSSSYQSLQEFEAHSLPSNTYDVLPQSTSKEKLKKNTRLTGRAEYIGVSLPVDISMIFQVSGTKCTTIFHNRKIINWFNAKSNLFSVPGFPLGLENLENLEEKGRRFPVNEKIREFWTDWKSQGKSHKILEKMRKFGINIIWFFRNI